MQTAIGLHDSYLIIFLLFNLLKVGVLNILGLRTGILLGLLLTASELVTAGLACGTALGVHLLGSSLPSLVEGCDG